MLNTLLKVVVAVGILRPLLLIWVFYQAGTSKGLMLVAFGLGSLILLTLEVCLLLVGFLGQHDTHYASACIAASLDTWCLSGLAFYSFFGLHYKCPFILVAGAFILALGIATMLRSGFVARWLRKFYPEPLEVQTNFGEGKTMT